MKKVIILMTIMIIALTLTGCKTEKEETVVETETIPVVEETIIEEEVIEETTISEDIIDEDEDVRYGWSFVIENDETEEEPWVSDEYLAEMEYNSRTNEW